MKPASVTAALAVAATLALAACGPKSSHPVCVDNYATADYMAKFSADRAAAKASGKITEAASDRSELDLLYFKPDPDDMGSLCVWADAERKKLGL